jgi:polyhydroxybutyrate depolymerase
LKQTISKLMMLVAMAVFASEANASVVPGDFSKATSIDGLTREYVVHVPRIGSIPETGIPLVIYIHGGGGTAQAAYGDGIDVASDRHEFLLLIPVGINKSWNGGSWAGGSCCGTQNDVKFFSTMIDEVSHDYPVDSRRIYAMGISNGGLMTNRLACELSTRIAAIATVAPAAVESNCAPTRLVPVMDIHGTGDRCNPYYGGTPPLEFCASVPYTRMTPRQVTTTWLRINGCSSVTPETVYHFGDANCLSFNHCVNSAEVEFCKVEGMGHTWPSGAQYRSSHLVGPVSHDISTEQIWQFFRRHPMP